MKRNREVTDEWVDPVHGRTLENRVLVTSGKSPVTEFTATSFDKAPYQTKIFSLEKINLQLSANFSGGQIPKLPIPSRFYFPNQ